MRINFKISGKIQGIGYRWFIKELAYAHNIDGWVCNLSDGNVEGEAQGKAEDLDAFLNLVKTGHPLATVESIQSQEMMDSSNTKHQFVIMPSRDVQADF